MNYSLDSMYFALIAIIVFICIGYIIWRKTHDSKLITNKDVDLSQLKIDWGTDIRYHEQYPIIIDELLDYFVNNEVKWNKVLGTQAWFTILEGNLKVTIYADSCTMKVEDIVEDDGSWYIFSIRDYSDYTNIILNKIYSKSPVYIKIIDKCTDILK